MAKLSIQIQQQRYMTWLVSRKNILPINLVATALLNDDYMQEFNLLNNYVKNALSKRSLPATIDQAAGFVLRSLNFKINGTIDLYDDLLHYAAVNGTRLNKAVMVSMVKAYAKERTDLNHPDGKGVTPLMLCLEKKNVHLFFALADNGVDIYAQDSHGFTPLHKIIKYIELGQMKIEVLNDWIKAGYKTNSKDKFGLTVYDHLQNSKNSIAAEMLKLLSSVKTEEVSEEEDSISDPISTVTLSSYDTKMHGFDTKIPAIITLSPSSSSSSSSSSNSSSSSSFSSLISTSKPKDIESEGLKLGSIRKDEDERTKGASDSSSLSQNKTDDVVTTGSSSSDVTDELS